MKKAAGLTTAALLSTLLIGGGSLFAAKPIATTTHPFVTIAGINPGGPMNFFSPSGNAYPGLDLEPLTYHVLYSPGNPRQVQIVTTRHGSVSLLNK